MRRPPGVIESDLLRKLLCELSGEAVSVLRLNFCGDLLDLEYPAVTRILEAVRTALPGVSLVLTTSGLGLSEDVCRLLLELRVDSVRVSIEGNDAASYSAVRGTPHYERVVANVRRLVRLRDSIGNGTTRVQVNTIDMPETHAGLGEFAAAWERVVDRVYVAKLCSRGGAVPIDYGSSKPALPCYRPFRQAVICYDGVVAACTQDWDCAMPLGDARCSSVGEIWRGKAAENLRRVHLRGDTRGLICAACHPEVWDSDLPPPGWYAELSRPVAEDQG